MFFVVGVADVSVLSCTGHLAGAPAHDAAQEDAAAPSGAPAGVPHRAVRPAPKAQAHPAGATAVCRDGTFSYAAHHQGACSHHGGALKFLT